MFQTPDGGVFSVDSNGFFRLSYGPPYRVTTSTWTGNDDGQKVHRGQSKWIWLCLLTSGFRKTQPRARAAVLFNVNKCTQRRINFNLFNRPMVGQMKSAVATIRTSMAL
jgi:hypothetical protein